MNIKENGGFTVAGDRALLSLPLGDTFHGIVVKGDATNLMTLDLLTRIVVRLNDRIIIDTDPRRFLKMDEYRAGNAAAYPDIMVIDFTERDAKDPVSEFLGSIGTGRLETFTAEQLAIFSNDMAGINVDSFKLELYAASNAVPLQYLRSWRKVSPPTPLTRHVLTILPYTHNIGGSGKWDLQIPKGVNCPHRYKRHWLFERRVMSTDPIPVPIPAGKIAAAELWKDDRTIYQVIREINEYEQRRYLGVPDPEMFVLDYGMYNYSATEALNPQSASDLFIRVETTGATIIDLFQEAYTDMSKSV